MNKLDRPMYCENLQATTTRRHCEEHTLPQYDLSAPTANVYERLFKRTLDQIIQDRYPKGYKVEILQRPVSCDRSICERGYLAARKEQGEFVSRIVMPKLRTERDFATGIHELCHLALYHHDPRYEAYEKSDYEKEKEVEVCSQELFHEMGRPWKYGRSDAQIKKLYNTSTAQRMSSARRNANLLLLTLGGVALVNILRGNTTSPPPISSSVFFSPIVPNMLLRGQDAWGNGAYGAPRTNSTGRHNGIDIVSFAGQAISSPMDAVVVRESRPYASPQRRRYLSGLLLQGIGEYSGYEIKMWYFEPDLRLVGQTIGKGTFLGIAQDMAPAFDSRMTNHIHIEVERNGRIIDPTPLFSINT